MEKFTLCLINMNKYFIILNDPPICFTGSEAAVEIENRLTCKGLIGDVRQLSPKYQTSVLEAKHSLDNNFVPFSYIGMKARLFLSALHYNENSGRLQAVKKDGKLRYSLSQPKGWTEGAHGFVIRPVKTAPTYGKSFRYVTV